MDSVIKTTLCLFIVILGAFTGIITYNKYVDTAYRSTINSSYTYTCTITTDAPLTNVTLFLPVPADTAGNSPIVSAYSSHTVTGIPPGWKTTLYDTGKATMVKVEAAAVMPPEGTNTPGSYKITFTAQTAGRTAIETKDFGEKGAMFRPVQDLQTAACPPGLTGGNISCFSYNTSLYAEYSTAGSTTVTITSVVSGENTWTIFGPRSNGFRADISSVLRGPNHGWTVAAGTLYSGLGNYEPPFGS